MKFIIGLLFIAWGMTLIYYRYKVYNITGEWDWAQKYIGGTVNALVLIGMLLIIIGVGYPFGTFDDFFSPSTPASPFWK